MALFLGTHRLGGTLGVEAIRQDSTVDFSIPMWYCELWHEEIFVDYQGSGDTNIFGGMGTGCISHV